MQPGRPSSDVRQTGVHQLVREYLSCARVRMAAVQNRDVDFAIVAAAAPSRRAGAFQVRFAALHNGDDTLVRAAAQLRSDARELLLEDCDHDARRIGIRYRPVISQKEAGPELLFAA